MLFIGLAPMGEPIVVSQSQLSKLLGINPATASRAISTLVAEGILVRDDSCGRCYWFDRQLAWRGDFNDRLESA